MRFGPLVASLALAGSALAGSAPTPAETHAVPTGPAPCGISARAGSVWVGVYEAGTLLGIDDASGRVQSRVTVGRWACRVAVGPAAIWVTRDRARELVRVSRGTGRLRRVPVGGMVFDVLLASGSVWATNYDTGAISRIDPATGKVTRRYTDGANPAGLATCEGRVWVGHGRNATWLTSIDPTAERVRRIAVGAAAPGWPDCIQGVVWVTTPESVLRLDPRTGRVLSRLPIGETLAASAAGPDGLVWVTDKQHSRVHRVTLDGRSVVDSFPAGPGAFDIVRAGGAMWVTSFAGADVRRYTP
jgi:streptogramin lyase